MNTSILPVILSGGCGSRLWPLSTAERPKQFLSLVSAHSLLQETAKRAKGIKNVLSPVVICNKDHRFVVAEQLHQVNIDLDRIIVEPCGRNTAPAVAMAAFYASLRQQDPMLLVLPSDAYIADADVFYKAVEIARQCAEDGYLVTFGIVPTKPETGYGYIRAGEKILEGHAFVVDSFVEKPNIKAAEQYVASGDYYWNSGMFLFRASVLLQELERHAPEVYATSQEAFERRTTDVDFCRVDATLFQQCPSISIDYAVMEKTDKAAVVPLDAGWSDIGSWSALWEVHKQDASGNVIKGDVIASEVKNSYLQANSRLLAVVGVENLVVVETANAVLVIHKDKAQSVKDLNLL